MRIIGRCLIEYVFGAQAYSMDRKYFIFTHLELSSTWNTFSGNIDVTVWTLNEENKHE